MERAAYDHAILDLHRAQTARERAEVVARLAALLGITVQSAYRNLGRLGWSSGRAKRADAGQSVLSQASLEAVATMMATGRNKRGQANLPTSEAHRIAEEHGLLAGDVSYGHLTRHLRKTGLSMVHMRAPEAGVARVSLHPNHVWFFDISIAIQWYFRDEATGKKLELYDDAGARFYEGKVANFKKLQRVIHRYALTDHFSGAYFVRYYYTAGERAEDVVDFLERGMNAKPQLGTGFPMRGRPLILVMDQGSANKSGTVRSLLTSLDIAPEYHEQGNAKASGSVESRHLHWQRSFEGRLSQGFAADLAELNEHAEQFATVAQSSRKHTRHGRPTMAMWATITREQLRDAPPRDVFLSLAMTEARERTLDSYLYAHVDGGAWQVTGENVYVGQKVKVRLAPWSNAGLRVWDEHGRELVAEKIEFDTAGFAKNGRRHVWGEVDAKGSSMPAPPAQVLAEATIAGERPKPVADVWGPLAEQLEAIGYELPAGTAWVVPVGEVAALPLLGELDVCDEIVRRLGRGLSAEEGAWWRAQAVHGITAEALESAWSIWCTPQLASVG